MQQRQAQQAIKNKEVSKFCNLATSHRNDTFYLSQDKVWHLIWGVACKMLKNWCFLLPMDCISCLCRCCTTTCAEHLCACKNLHTCYFKRLGAQNYANRQYHSFSSVQFAVKSKLLQDLQVCYNHKKFFKEFSQVMELNSLQTCLKLKIVTTGSWLLQNVTQLLFLVTWDDELFAT